jgi:phenylacetate-CoA ligase
MTLDGHICRLGYRVLMRRRRQEIRCLLQRTTTESVLSQLEALLRYAAAHVPYYARALSGSVDLLEQFRRLPPLTKALLREHGDALRSDELSARPHILNSSGGSTGQPVTLVQDREFKSWCAATEAFYYERFLGIVCDETRKVILWGSERDIFSQTKSWKRIVWNRLTQTTFLNSFRMTEQEMIHYVDAINEQRPEYIRGYAGSLFELARFIRRHELPVYRPRLICSSAETLRPFMRELVESVFGCPVFDFYGSREVGAIGGQCRRGKMHLFSFNNLVEVVDDENCPVSPGEQGKLLITALHNTAMPLIRYEIGDTAVLGDGCDCGSPLPTLERITGRVTDHFTTRSGSLIHGEYFTHLFYFKEWVREFQVLQTELDEVQVYYAPKSPAPAEDVDDINRKIHLVMGQDCRVQWHEVSEVPRTPQGKLLFTRSLVQAPPRREETAA